MKENATNILDKLGLNMSTYINMALNKIDIRDFDKLHVFERKLTMLRLLELMDKPISGKFDFEHVQAIHKYIFQDIYEWSGKVRTVDIAKGNKYGSILYQRPKGPDKIYNDHNLCESSIRRKN